MQQHKFLLIFRLSDCHEDPRIHTNALLACRDANPCFSMRGYLGMQFDRSGHTLSAAKRTAVEDVLHIIPGAILDNEPPQPPQPPPRKRIVYRIHAVK